MANTRQKFGKLAATAVSEAAFGVAYNALIGRLEDRMDFDHDRVVSIEVAIGVAATIIIGALTGFISWRTARRVLALFVATGTPMIVGSLQRDHKRKAAYGLKNRSNFRA